MQFKKITLILLLPTALAAQEPAPNIPASFYAFDYAPGQETVEIQSGPESFEQVRLSKANIVGPVPSVIAGNMLRTYAKPAAVDGKVTHPVLSATKLPVGIKRALVVMFPNPKGSAEAYRSIVFEHDLTGFPLGVYRLSNLSPHPVRGSIARAYIEAKPGEVTSLDPAGEPGAVVPLRFEYFNEGHWNLLAETRSAIRKDRRWLVFIYKDPVTGRMNVRTIPDRTASD